MEKYYLGFDAGTQSVKAAVYDSNMQCVTEHSTPTVLRYPHPGWVEMDADQYVEAAVESIAACVKEMREKGLSPENIRAIFGDGVILGIVGVDEDGNAITPYVNYLDSRTQADAEKLAALGLDIWAKETGNPMPNCMFPALFARWFLRNSEAFQNRGKNFSITRLIFCPILLDVKQRMLSLTGAHCLAGDLGIKSRKRNGVTNSWKYWGCPKNIFPKSLNHGTLLVISQKNTQKKQVCQ